MRKIRGVLRLTLAEGLSRRRVSAAVRLPLRTVSDYVSRAQEVGLGWPLPEGMDDRELEARLFVSAGPPAQTRALPDWAEVHSERWRKGMMLQALEVGASHGTIQRILAHTLSRVSPDGPLMLAIPR